MPTPSDDAPLASDAAAETPPQGSDRRSGERRVSPGRRTDDQPVQDLRHDDRLRLLATITSDTDGPLEARVARALRAAAEMLGLDIGILSDIQGEVYTVLACYAAGGGLASGDTFALGDTYCAITLRAGDVLAIDHMEVSEHRRHPCYAAFGLETYLGAPVLVGGVPVGTLSFSAAAPRAAPFTDADRDVLRLLATWTGAQIEAERRISDLAERGRHLSAVLDSAPLLLFSLDADGRFTLSEGKALATLGLAPGEIVGQSVFEMYPDEPVVLSAIRSVLRGRPSAWESTVGGASFSTHAEPILGADGAPQGMVGVAVDVTQQRAIEARLAERERHLRAIVDATPVIVYAMDADGVFTHHEGQGMAELGLRSSDIVGRSVFELNGDQPESNAAIRTALSGESDGWIRYTVRVQDHTLDCSASTVYDADGNVAGVLGVSVDATARVEAEAALRDSERRLRAFTRASFEGITLSEGGLVIDANEQAAQLFGFRSAQELVGRSAADLVAPEELARVRDMWLRNRTGAYEVQCVRADGERVWLEVQGHPMPHDGRTVRVTAFRDITARKAAEARTRFQADVLGHVSDAVVALDLDGRVTYWNGGAERLHGIAAEDAMGHRLSELVRYAVEALPQESGPARRPASAPEALQSPAALEGLLVFHRPTPGGPAERRYVQVSSNTLTDERGDERGLLAVIRDVTAQRHLAERLRHQATHDALTGLPNRLFFRERLDHALADGEPFAVFFVDLDRFKYINDTLGHDAGDGLLRTVAVRLREAIASIEGAVIARLGGDEFGAIVPAADPEAASAAAHAVHRSLAPPVAIGAREVRPAASVGVVTDALGYATAEALLRDADTAMYVAKHEGRDRVRLFDRSMHEAVARRFAIEADLRRAVEAEELGLALQPIVSLTTGAVVGMEALVRWTHPAHGPVPPSEFIPIAEEIGLVAAIDRWALGAAIAEIGGWSAWLEAAAAGGLHVSVNCAPQTFLDAGLAEAARAAADAAGLPEGALTLELTERALVDTDTAPTALAALHARGIRLNVDDFGTGFSSLGLLHSLDVDGLKVDRSFVADIATSASSRAVVRSVLALGRDLGLTVIAEGIETAAQRDALRELGCAYGQGYAFAPPLPPDQARALALDPPWLRAG